MHADRHHQIERIKTLKLAAAIKRSQRMLVTVVKQKSRHAVAVVPSRVNVFSSSSAIRQISAAESKKLQLWLCSRPRDIQRLTGNLCCETGVLLDRDSAVRLFYHSVFPCILSERQSSHLLLYMCRRAHTNIIAESWHEENTFFQTLRPQGNLTLEHALRLLQEVVNAGRPYALRVVVEAPGCGAHALLLLLQGSKAWLLDPNGDFGMVHLYFGSRETLVSRIREVLKIVGCELSVPQLPSLHSPDKSGCLQEYCRGGACTFVTGVVALRALESGNPEIVLRKLATGGTKPADVAREVDELVTLTIACHVVSEKCARQDLRSKVCQLVSAQ